MATIAFDVNETLLSLEPMRAAVGSVLSPDATGHWFAQLLHGSLVANHLGLQRTFEEVGATELQRLAAAAGTTVSDDQARSIAKAMRALPPHPDVEPGLAALRAAGHRLVAFTNGSSDAVHDQLVNAGIDGHFDAMLSVDAGTTFKPHPSSYATLAALLRLDPSEVTMVAAHDWDVAGARAAGMRAVFLQRGAPAWWLPVPQGPTATGIAGVADHL